MRKIVIMCDRCGVQFRPSMEDEYSIESEFCGKVDLCPECIKELKKWLRSKPNE